MSLLAVSGRAVRAIRQSYVFSSMVSNGPTRPAPADRRPMASPARMMMAAPALTAIAAIIFRTVVYYKPEVHTTWRSGRCNFLLARRGDDERAKRLLRQHA